MNISILKIKKLRKTHNELLSFLNKEKATGSEIRNWVADCVVYFSEINLQQNIINNFINKIEFYEKEEFEEDTMDLSSVYDIHKLKKTKTKIKTGIGPFPFAKDEDGYIISKNNNRLSPEYSDTTQMTIIFIAFKVAEKILDNYEDEERIIPKYLLNELNKKETQDIYLSLKSIQTSYETRSSKNILAFVVTTTELICKLIPELNDKKYLSDKLNKIYSNETIIKKYNLNKEVIWAINNSRIIRNYDIHSPKKANHTTIYEVVGYCHLLILFISSLLASGEIKL